MFLSFQIHIFLFSFIYSTFITNVIFFSFLSLGLKSNLTIRKNEEKEKNLHPNVILKYEEKKRLLSKIVQSIIFFYWYTEHTFWLQLNFHVIWKTCYRRMWHFKIYISTFKQINTIARLESLGIKGHKCPPWGKFIHLILINL